MSFDFLDAQEKNAYRRTKIVATLGPASNTPTKIEELINAGANVFRLNFSHGTHTQHGRMLRVIRKISENLGKPVGILQDLSGPKLRISAVDDDYLPIEDDQYIELRHSEDKITSKECIYLESIKPEDILKPGHHILLADGILELKADEVGADFVKCKIIKGGRIRSHVGIAFPDSDVDLPATTEKDLEDLMWGIENEVDFVAMSFVKNAADVNMVKKMISDHNVDCSVIAKIERRAALENITEIIDASDGLMVARGDLGLELPLEQVPLVQKKLIELANNRGIPVIVATQMLHSMITSIRPTRAEVSDIAAAVMTGADAVMLSEETAIGEHPVNAVEYLGKIAETTGTNQALRDYKLKSRSADAKVIPDSVAYAACAAADKIDATMIIACTSTGTSARLVSKYRPQQPLYGASMNEATLRKMCLFWGVIPITLASADSHLEELDAALDKVRGLVEIESDSVAVTIGGHTVSTPGSTSIMEIHKL